MSRDLTPVQYYLLSEHNKDRGLSAFDVMESMSWTINGVSHRLHSKEDMELRRQYPLFGFLLNSFPKTHAALSKIPEGISYFKKKEEELSAYINAGSGDRNSALIKWFKGELDPHFYYSERNEELFVEALLDGARAVSREPLDSRISSASTRAADLASGDKTRHSDLNR